jgi:protein tyrosine/serine phosphatase
MLCDRSSRRSRQPTDPGMQKIAKDQRRALRRRFRSFRQSVVDASPAWLRRAVGPIVLYADMLLVDHGVFRLFYLNRHPLGSRAWRAAQPAPHQLARIASLGVKTVVNLRGARVCGSYWLEQAACAKHGMTLVDYQVRSRAAPSKQELLGARDLLSSVEYPILLHCKSGADRAGLMSTLYMIVREGKPVAEAKQQLALSFGHIRQSDTGILDYFFERYLADTATSPMPFFDWVERVYDPEELKRTFHAKGWANVLVNRVLRRE